MNIKGLVSLTFALVSVGFVAINIPIAQAVELAQLSDQQWDEYSGDNTRFDGTVWTTGLCRETEDERSKTPPEIAQLYTNLSKAAVGARYPHDSWLFI